MATTVTSHGLVREGTLSALRALTSRGSPWPEPTLSVGRQIGKLGSKELCWEAVGSAREAFTKICPRIKEHLESGVETVSSWVTWSMYMIGKAPEHASPTILFCCEISAHRKLVRKVIKESGILDKYPGIKTGHASRPPDFNQLVRLAGAGHPPGPDTVIEGLVAPHGNACGMELAIITESRDFSQSRCATVGGVIQLDQKFFYFTAEHAFQPASEEDSYGNFSDSDNDSDFSIDDDVLSDVTEKFESPDCTSIGKLNICANVGRSDGSQENEPSSIGPSFSERMKQKEIKVVKETIRLSSVAISSRADPATNLDYNLIEVSNPDHQYPNSVNYGGKELSINEIVVDGPKDVSVLAITSRGILGGRLSGTSMYTSLPTAGTYQEVYYGIIDSPLEIGDCGSWIIDANTGDLFGHVVAGSPKTGAAMIIPAVLTFTDLEARTQIRPRLPTTPLQLLPTYADTKRQPTTDKKKSARSRQLSQYDIAWTKNVSLQFGELMRQKHKMYFIKRFCEPTPRAECSTTVDAIPPSYDQIMKDTTLRDRLRRRYPRIPEPPAAEDRDAQRFRNLLIKLSEVPLMYEDPELQEAARATMPLEEIYAKAAEKEFGYEESAQQSGGDKRRHWDFMDCSIIAMMSWFKNHFFTWVNNPPCPECQSATVPIGMGAPTEEEFAWGALRVELFQCSNSDCLCYERFPRYKDPRILMRTRRGRVGEWANCFGLYCRALGARVRWVWTANDHVFVEVYSQGQRRWVHCDPCENAFDKPRLYSDGKLVPHAAGLAIANTRAAGWGKALSYVIAFSAEGAADVTRRYVREVSRFRERPRLRCSEEVLVHIMREITAMRRTSLADEDVARLQKEDAYEQLELSMYIVSDMTQQLVSSLSPEGATKKDAKRQAEELAELEYSQAREAA